MSPTSDQDGLPTVTLDSTVLQAGRVTAVELDGETVVYDPDNGELHLLDRVATVVWSCLDGTDTLDDICHDLAEAYGEPLGRVCSDVLALASSLAVKGLIELVESSRS